MVSCCIVALTPVRSILHFSVKSWGVGHGVKASMYMEELPCLESDSVASIFSFCQTNTSVGYHITSSSKKCYNGLNFVFTNLLAHQVLLYSL